MPKMIMRDRIIYRYRDLGILQGSNNLKRENNAKRGASRKTSSLNPMFGNFKGPVEIWQLNNEKNILSKILRHVKMGIKQSNEYSIQVLQSNSQRLKGIFERAMRRMRELPWLEKATAWRKVRSSQWFSNCQKGFSVAWKIFTTSHSN